MNNKDNKIADNRIEKSKKKIAQIDESIDIEKNKLKKIDNIQEEFVSLNKSINRCIELLSSSIKGTKTPSLFPLPRQCCSTTAKPASRKCNY